MGTGENDGIAETGDEFYLEMEIEADVEAIVPVTVEVPIVVDVENTGIVTTTATAPGD